jgi:hypothetical protein
MYMYVHVCISKYTNMNMYVCLHMNVPQSFVSFIIVSFMFKNNAVT